ncbi:MAG TPA: ATP-binding protein [Candidatus Elarobacter sp.]
MMPLPDQQIPRPTAARSRVEVEEDARSWTVRASAAAEAGRQRGAFRAYLERYGDAASDFDAAEAVYGELLNTCLQHAPGRVEVRFAWDDATLVVIDDRERLRTWPFSPDDTSAESTHHAYALISAYTGRIRLAREPRGGTRASVALPVRRR